MKRVLITAGPVYGRLDSNKLVSNRTRGIWAAGFAKYLLHVGHRVTLLVADTSLSTVLRALSNEDEPSHPQLTILQHSGYEQYADLCYQAATTHDAAILAAAVVNWIPANPVTGKMQTAGYREGDVIQVPFVLARRVINRMRELNPNLTLIGCKMLVGEPGDKNHETREKLVAAARHVIEDSKAHACIANDLNQLQVKHVCYPDGAVITRMNDFQAFYSDLRGIIEDEHYRTVLLPNRRNYSVVNGILWRARDRFTLLADRYRDRFMAAGNHVFGALAVPVSDGTWLVSGRHKDRAFTGQNAVHVHSIDHDKREVYVLGNRAGQIDEKASMNAPLLLRMGNYHLREVLHLHEQLPDVPTQPYFPPGTVRDSMRDVTFPEFNIEHHGFIRVLPERKLDFTDTDALQ